MSDSKQKTTVVILTHSLKQNQIEKMVKKYPALQLRNVYKHAITGFSVAGTKEDVAKLQQESLVSAVTEVSVYHVALDQSVPFIGGDRARSFFDINKQRITGKGVKVGVIDTGIDYTHPDLQRAYKGKGFSRS